MAQGIAAYVKIKGPDEFTPPTSPFLLADQGGGSATSSNTAAQDMVFQCRWFRMVINQKSIGSGTATPNSPNHFYELQVANNTGFTDSVNTVFVGVTEANSTTSQSVTSPWVCVPGQSTGLEFIRARQIQATGVTNVTYDVQIDFCP